MPASRIGVGHVVRVYKGRSAPLGTEGVVFWSRIYKYGKIKPGMYARITTRLGIAKSDARDADGNLADVVWSYSDNVTVIGEATAPLGAGEYLLAHASVPF